MSERVKDDQLHRLGTASGPSPESQRLDLNGIEVRIDGAHPQLGDLETRQVEWPSLQHFVPSRAAEPVMAKPVTDSSRLDLQFFQDTAQRAQQMQHQMLSQLASLDQREQS